MITINKIENSRTHEGEAKQTLEFRGLSTDQKPTENVDNGSIYIEIDTGKFYLFDLENEQWNEV
jgi:hypothetical protein